MKTKNSKTQIKKLKKKIPVIIEILTAPVAYQIITSKKRALLSLTFCPKIYFIMT